MLDYLVVYDSETGNTKKAASCQHIHMNYFSQLIEQCRHIQEER